MHPPASYEAIRIRRGPLAVLVALVSLSCGGDRIGWTDPMTVSSAIVDAQLVVDMAGRASFVPDTSVNVMPAGAGRICPTSLQTARQDDATLVAVWWSVRADSSAVLLSAVSPDGGEKWDSAVHVDTTDVSVTGCSRPAPAIAASAGFVHLAYSMQAAEGTGVFYAHSMTHGRSYEAPIAIVYGDRVTPAAVSADRANVAVVYEDPSGATPQVGLAISRDWGHIFDDRVRGSTGLGPATMPQVAVAGREIAVSWLQRWRGVDSASRATRVVRVGGLP